MVHVIYHKALRTAQSMDQHFSLLRSLFPVIPWKKIPLLSFLSHRNK